MSEYIPGQEKETYKNNIEENNKLSKEDEEKYFLEKNKISLNELEQLVEEGSIDIDEKTLKEIKEDNKLDEKELDTIVDSIKFNEIINKLEEIEKDSDIDKILPKELKIQDTEFKEACKDKNKRQILFKKIDEALDYINDQLHSGNSKIGGNPLMKSINMRENLLFLANKKAIKIQENMIDMKNYLDEI
ncbi:hypothetical protein K9M48_02865 [Candidatus Gracilibacteria bacterium]|nr:hypothetical protein [Candidatus Gracilibacteria bacterium]